ncbi:AAA family ATPase [Streptomyces sp. NPDC001933]|uniref:AAA family ATPase n=1 Tax=Streptomyces sp. NPDC001933 TaxID=3364626 RepID=UPI0036C12F40
MQIRPLWEHEMGRLANVLVGRRAERVALTQLITALRATESRALVLCGEPGVGKTALLDFLAAQAVGCHVLRVVGLQSEMELAFAGLHQLCAPFLDRTTDLPAPQRDALRVAFGLEEGPTPDRFLVALAVLGLLSSVAGEQPLLIVVDDQQWLDRASAQALGFVARRLAADPIALVFGTRVPGDDLTGLPELRIAGLPEADARALFDSTLIGPMDPQVRNQILAEADGNPLALLELPRDLTPAQLAGGFGLPSTTPLTSRIEESFHRRLSTMPDQTQSLLLLAAADPSGDSALVWRAAARLGIPQWAAGPAIDADLAEFGTRVRFRHPLLRSAAYRAGSPAEREAAHLALAEATDPQVDPDRQVWHWSKSSDAPDEEIAAALERSAGRAQARGGPAAAAAFLERSVRLSLDPTRRVERVLAAAQANLRAGAYDPAQALLASAEVAPLTELQSARVDLLRGYVAFARGLGSEAPPLILKAAERLEPLDLDLARDTYLMAWMSALFTGSLATGGGLAEVSASAQQLPRSARPERAELVLDSLTLLVTEGLSAAAPKLRLVADTFTDPGIPPTVDMRWGWFAQAASSALGDLDTWRVMLERQVGAMRTAGLFDSYPVMLAALGTATAWSGDFDAAAALVTESEAVCEATGTQAAPFTSVILASLRGDQTLALPLIEATVTEATASGQGIAVAFAHWAAAILHNGHGRYDKALAAAEQASSDAPGLYVSLWALPELIEAAARTGASRKAEAALERLAKSAQAGSTDFGLGVEARSRALLSTGANAEALYEKAIDLLARTRLRPELGRAHLLYGEWLRRENRRGDARTHLHAAHDLLSEIGANAFAERARHELLATGERVRKHTVANTSVLTAQESLIARLACEGRTNPEIGAQLFLSARTVEWHLRKVYGKLGVSSRKDLSSALKHIVAPTAR